eukprot:1595524-Lingulodinium_polyedra.AAC.1
MLHNDAFKRAVRRFSAAACATHARATRAPFHGARVARACAAQFAALKRHTARVTASLCGIFRNAARRC